WLGHRVPLRKYNSTQPQIMSTNMMAPAINANQEPGRRSEKWLYRPGTAKNGSIHQPLLSRSCSRLIEVARKIQRNSTVPSALTSSTGSLANDSARHVAGS